MLDGAGLSEHRAEVANLIITMLISTWKFEKSTAGQYFKPLSDFRTTCLRLLYPSADSVEQSLLPR